MTKAVLLIADHDTRLIVATALECAGYACEVHGGTPTLMRALRRDKHELVIVDGDGSSDDCEAVLGWRDGWLEPTVAIVTIGGSDPSTSIRALEAGADDVVLRPVRGPELLARVAAAVRRRQGSTRPVGLGGCECRVDAGASALVSTRGRVELTPRELALARLMFDNAGQLVTRARISHDVLGQPEDPARRSIEQHIYQLRRKLRRCAGEDIALRGVYGSGYRLDATATPPRAGSAVLALRASHAAD